MEPLGFFFGLILLGLSYKAASHNAIRKELTMAETTSKEAEAGVLMTKEQIETLLGNSAMTLGDVQVIGLELISPKFAAIVNHLLTREPWGIETLAFSAEYPTDKYGMYSASQKLVVINVAQHWDSVVELVQHDEHYLSVRGHLWHNMLLTLLHELIHSKGMIAGPEEYAAMSPDERDEMAEEVANDELEELAKLFEIEPAPMSEEPFFGTRYMQLFIDSISNSKDTWAIRQNEMHDEKHVYIDETGNVIIESFRDYVRGTFDKNRKDKSWEVEVIPLTAFTFPIVPVADAPKDVVIVDESGAATVVAASQVAPTAVVVDEMVEPVGDVGGGSWEDDALMHLLGESDTPDIEPSMTMAPGAGAPTVAAAIQAEYGAKPTITDTAAPASAFCTQCGDPIVATNAFCGKCGKAFVRVVVKAITPEPTAAAVAAEATTAPWQTDPPTVEPTYNANVEPHSAWQTAYNGPQQTHVQNRRIEKLDTGLPPHNLTGPQITEILNEVYMRLYNFCFDQCGWQMPLPPQVLQDQTGTLCKDGFNRDVRTKVLAGVSVADIPGVNQLIYAYRSIDANGQYNKIPADGMIRGWVAKEAKIPMFNLYLNVNTGEAAKRVFIPQNPFKVKNGKYSDTAMQAQGGAKLAYVINGDDRIPDNDQRKYVADIKGGYLTFK